jgi:hypothetical protein
VSRPQIGSLVLSKGSLTPVDNYDKLASDGKLTLSTAHFTLIDCHPSPRLCRFLVTLHHVIPNVIPTPGKRGEDPKGFKNL